MAQLLTTIYGNMTSNDLIHDAEKAVNVLVHAA